MLDDLDLHIDILEEIWQDFHSFLLQAQDVLLKRTNASNYGRNSCTSSFSFLLLGIPKQLSTSVYHDALDDLAGFGGIMWCVLGVLWARRWIFGTIDRPVRR